MWEINSYSYSGEGLEVGQDYRCYHPLRGGFVVHCVVPVAGVYVGGPGLKASRAVDPLVAPLALLLYRKGFCVLPATSSD